jgi:hypothetical protein
LPGSKTAAELFRELLAMSPDERAQALADRSPQQRSYLEGRLREYQALPLEERELRLKQLELTCHMDILMRLAPTNRAARLKAVPADLRPIIDERLRQWDLLSPKVQQGVLEYKTTANFFLRARGVNLQGAPAVPRVNGGLDPSVGTPDEKPSRIADLNQLLESSERDQQKTLAALPPAERDAIEETLRAFAHLTPEQRRICINSFNRFSRMTPQQRDQFLKNAARWKAMSTQERETWRTLIQIVPAEPPETSAPPIPPATQGSRGPATVSNSSTVR